MKNDSLVTGKKYNLKLVMGSGNYSQVGYQKRGFCAKGLYPELPGITRRVPGTGTEIDIKIPEPGRNRHA